MPNTNELNYCIKGNVLFIKPQNATKQSLLLEPQLVQESRVTYYFTQHLI